MKSVNFNVHREWMINESLQINERNTNKNFLDDICQYVKTKCDIQQLVTWPVKLCYNDITYYSAYSEAYSMYITEQLCI